MSKLMLTKIKNETYNNILHNKPFHKVIKIYS